MSKNNNPSPLPKGIKVRGNVYYITVYSPERGRSIPITTKLPATKTNLALAKKIRDQKIRELKSPVIAPVPSAVTLLQGLENYISSRELSASSEYLYRFAMDLLELYLGDVVISSVTQLECDKFFKQLKTEGYSQNSVSIFSRHLLVLFNFFVTSKYCSINPITKQKIDEKPVTAIPAKDFVQILRYLRKRHIAGHDLIKFLALSGLRISEALALPWSSVDFNKNILKVNNFKGKRTDYIPLLDPLRVHLLQMHKRKKNEKMFPFTDRKIGFYGRCQDKLWEEKRYTIHQLRKTFISGLANSGVSPVSLKTLARHENIKTTLRFYTEADLEKIAKEVNTKIKNR